MQGIRTLGVALAGNRLLHHGLDLVTEHAQPVVHLRAVAPDVQRVRHVVHRVRQQREGLPARPTSLLMIRPGSVLAVFCRSAHKHSPSEVSGHCCAGPMETIPDKRCWGLTGALLDKMMPDIS